MRSLIKKLIPEMVIWYKNHHEKNIGERWYCEWKNTEDHTSTIITYTVAPKLHIDCNSISSKLISGKLSIA
jgi:hypothetical protein